jgi:putative ABC transport system ATP-binding protein
VTALLVAHRVGRRFAVRGAEVVALSEVSLAVEPGEVVAVTGPSGSGKSTLLSLLAGWDRPTEGEVRRPPGPTGTVFLPQRVPLVEQLTVGDNLDLARPGGVPPAEVAAVAHRLAVDALLGRYPAEASVGERQRVGIARSLLAGAGVLLLDEPTAHQDAAHGALVLAALAPDDRHAVVLSTHDAEVAATATREVRLRRS